ncbi:MAG: hypothetical protein JSV19_03625 [Phycisphaerales bacterium]|nr:MAG: hypothetical protein JSV19_03625 [Phycisphaerales bacterium]
MLRQRFILAASLAVVGLVVAGPGSAQVPEGAPASRDAVLAMTPLTSDEADELHAFRKRIYVAIEKQAHYLLGTVHPWSEDVSLRLLTESKSGEHWIRPNTGAVAGFAFLHRFGSYDAARVGVTRSQLLQGTVLPMMRYLIVTHVTGDQPTSDGRKWGDHWQSAHWAHMLGRGAWWIWEDLPADVQAGVRRVVAHEADRIARSQPPAQMTNDTKSEENAWNSQVMSVAVLLMPDDARRAGWEAAFQKWALSAYLRPADETSETVVDGRSLREQFTGANIYEDFTLENHGIVHPDYMTAFSLSLGCMIDYAMTGRRPPEALMHNIPGIYENLKWFLLPDGGFVYPSGQDWRLFRNPDWIFKHALMAVFARDPEAWPLAVGGLETLERMQARSASGAVYYPGEYFFPSTQHDMLYYLGLTWLSLHLVDTLPAVSRERTGVRRLDSGKIVIHRTPHSIHTVSWGARVMAQCVPYRLDRIVSPHARNGIGHVRVKGSEKALPVRVRRVEVSNDSESFAADLVLDHGQEQIRAHLTCRSNPNGTWVMRERLEALADVTTTEIATGLIGILNNPHWVYEKGRREVALGQRRTTVESGSGIVLDGEAVTDVAVDSVLRVHGAAPLCVRYVSAKKPERARFTDRLYLNYDGKVHAWHEGDVISEFEVIVHCLPGATSRPAAAFAGQVEALKRIRRRIVAERTVSALPPDSAAYQAHVRRLDARVDELLAMPDGYWSRYRDAGQPPISANGFAWGDPLSLATAHATSGSRHYQSDPVLQAASDGLRHLMRFAHPGCPQQGNWWAWQIGIPRKLLPTLFLIGHRLEPELLRDELATLTYLLKAGKDAQLTGPYTSSPTPYQGKTDTNALWHAGLRFQLAILLENPAMAGKWANKAFGEIAPAGAGHLQADYSFKFHGPIPMWAYGDSFLGDYATLVNWCTGTPFGPHPEQLDHLAQMAEHYVEGFLYRGRICPAMIGRTLTRSDRHYYVSYGPAGLYALSTVARAGHPQAERLAGIVARERAFYPESPERWATLATGFSRWDNQAEILHPLAARLALALQGLPEAAPAPPTSDVFAYPDSDFIQVTRPDWAVGIKLHSQRNRAYESINGENLRGWFLSHGTMFHFIRGDEWAGCWPTLDWTRLPGTTVAAEVKRRNESPFVGVLRGSPQTGLAALDLQVAGFRARKSWVIDGDRIICQGSAIVGTGRVETTVFNQPVPVGALLLIDGEPAPADSFEQTLTVRSLWLQDMGYVFPGGCELRISRASRASDWSAVRDPNRYGASSPVTHDYLTGVISHSPAKVSYQYVVLPAASDDAITLRAHEVDARYDLRDDGPHRVATTDGQLEAIVLWEAANVGTIQSDRGCLALRNGDAWQVVDPAWATGSMTVRIGETTHALTALEGRPITLTVPKDLPGSRR